jgi:hypothetical protein
MKLSTPPALAVAFSMFTLAGCAFQADDETADPELIDIWSEGLTAVSGVTTVATYQEVVTGTPTYGYPATSPVLTIHVEVDDAALRKQFPSFDGMESAFALVPKQINGALVWESVALSWTGTTSKGYYGQIVIDIQESGSVWGVDWPTLGAHGVAVGLTTNAGTIWTQAPGQNWPVVKK